MDKYFDTNALITAVKSPHKIVLNSLYGIRRNDNVSCDVDLKIHRTMSATQLINILSGLADILPDCDLTINLKK